MTGRRTLTVEIGQQFGRLTMLREERIVTAAVPRGARAALCQCSCGQTKLVRIPDLLSGATTSCGCIHREFLASPQHRAHLTANGQSATNLAHLAGLAGRNRSHDLTHHPLYSTHAHIISRCLNPQDKSYRHYGGRGITLHSEWRDVSVFIAWIEQNLGPRPEGIYPSGMPHYSLDRIDNDGNYEPGNMRWATVSEQQKNKRGTRIPPDWDSPGCGCPRDQHYAGTDPKLLPVQKRGDPPLPMSDRKPEGA